MFRHDPVIGIKCKRGVRYGKRYYRYPSTTQEMRQYYACPEYVRAKRRPRYLPVCYDDIQRESNWNHKNWKLYRKTQYKAVVHE